MFRSIAVTRSKNVPIFGPPIPAGALFPKTAAFTRFLLTKIVNAENAAHRSDKFVSMATRTRQEYLKDLATNYVTPTTLDSGSKFGKSQFCEKKMFTYRIIITFVGTVGYCRKGSNFFVFIVDTQKRLLTYIG
jgi:hypothetical protein